MFWQRVRLILWKEFLEMLRDRAMIPLLFIMPVVQLLLFGYVVGTDIRNITTVVVDHDKTESSRQVVLAFRNSGFFKVVGSTESEAEMGRTIDSNDAQVGLIFPPGFEAALKQRRSSPVELVLDASDSRTSSVAQGNAAGILADVGRRLVPVPPKNAMPGGIPTVDARVRVLFNPSLRSVNTMVPALIALIQFLMVTALMSQAVVKERERGTLEQMFVTPVTRSQYLIGKTAPYAIMSLVQVTLVFTVGTLWFRVPFNGNLALLAFSSVLFLFTAMGQGLIVSMLSRTRYQAQLITMFTMWPSILLSGFVFPIESMPRGIQVLTYVIPLRYFLVVLRSIFMKGSNFIELWPQLAAMAAFSAGIYGFALTRFRKKLAD